MKHQRMNNNGFTLIETTVAMLVMMVVGLGATSLFLYSVRYNSGAAQRSVAMAIAQQRLEILRGADYDDAGLSFGTHDPETIVMAPSTTTYTQSGSAGSGQPSGAPVAAGNYASAWGGQTLASVNTLGVISALALVRPTPRPTATPTPTTGGGGGTSNAPAGSSFYQLQVEVVPFPIGTAVANAKQKQITIQVFPLNGNGADAWSNQNPVEVIFHRSLGVPGPYKE
jgi:type II secretory pathway pseudopilin PulG